MPIQPVVRRSVSDDVFDQLRGEILSGRLAAGEALPSERALTEMTGVNRQAVREALKRLDQAGLVAINQGDVTRVRDFRTSAGLDLLGSLLVGPTGRVDVMVARSIMEMRACIGPDAARLCAARATPELVHDLRALLQRMDEHRDGDGDGDGDVETLAQLDWEFWERIIDGADNLAYRLAFNSLRDSAAPLADVLPAIVGDELRDRRDHISLVSAIEKGDGARAERAARRLLSLGVTAIAQAVSVDRRPAKSPTESPARP